MLLSRHPIDSQAYHEGVMRRLGWLKTAAFLSMGIQIGVAIGLIYYYYIRPQ